jgi:hypothetical protein
VKGIRHFPMVLAAGLGLVAGGSFFGPTASAAANPIIDPANGHSYMASGKPLPHPSGGTEVTFNEERNLGADNTASSDAPPDATVSALGCSNRGSATNPRVNQDCTLRRQAEEQVVVNPFDASNVIAGQNDSRVGFNKCGFDYSLDGGTTWGDGLPPFQQHLSLIGHTYDAASDPALTFDGTGRAWYSCVLFDINSNASGLAVVPSTPALKGAAYSNVGAGPSRFVVAEDASGAHFFDKEFIAGDHRPGNTSVYVTFTDFQSANTCRGKGNQAGFCDSPIFISKWTGSGWTAPLEISGTSPMCVGGQTFDQHETPNACNFDQGSFPVVLPNGDVYVTFSNFNTPSLVDQQMGVLVHVNGNTLTPTAPVRVGLDNENSAALCDFGRGPEQCVDSINIRSDDFPALSLDPTDASHLVAAWTDTRAATGSGNYDVVVSESHDGGMTWTDRNGGGTVLTTSGAFFEPSVAVSSGGTTVASMYHANTARHTTTVGDGTYGYGFEVKSGGSFGGYQPASDGQSYPSPQANPTQAGFLGDYSSAAAGPSGNTVYLVWSDTRNSNSTLGPDEDVFVFKMSL